MELVAKLIKTDGTIQNVVPGNGKSFSLEEMQRMVGGYIQMCYPPSKVGAVMVINEDGKKLGLSLNPLATQIWQEDCDPGSDRSMDPIVGNVLLCHESQVE